jgi:hypothetical protein
MRDFDAALVEGIEDGPAVGTDGARQPNFEIAAQQPSGFFRHGPFDVRAEERHADQGPHAHRDAHEKIEKMPPAGPRFPPGHGEDKRDHAEESPACAPIGGRESASIRPSRKDTTRSIDPANAGSWVTSTSVVP